VRGCETYTAWLPFDSTTVATARFALARLRVHANNDKIVIKRDADGHWVYFSVRNIRTDVKRREDVATPYVDPKSDPRQTGPRR
jgi:hypothetical protein